MSGDKECFVICPIGSEGSEERERADKLMEHIIKEAVDEFGYTPVRADHMTDPGSITSQIIQKVVEADLVIADLTSHNPNVFYELAVRHATGKPFIQVIDSSEGIPFDIADLRTIKYDFDVSRARQASEEIKQHIETLEEDEPEYDNPISRSAELNSLRRSEDPIQQNLADIMDGLNKLNRQVNYLEEEMKSSNDPFYPKSDELSEEVKKEAEELVAELEPEDEGSL